LLEYGKRKVKTMGLSDRIESTVERWSDKWKDRIAGWVADTFFKTTEKVLDTIEDEGRGEAMPMLNKLRDIPDLPPEMSHILDMAEEKHMPQAVIAILPYMIGMLIGFGMGSARPVMNWSSYFVEKVVKSFRLPPEIYIPLERRYGKEFEGFVTDMADLGLSDERLEAMRKAFLYFPSPQEGINWLAHEVFEEDAVEKYGLDDEFEGLDPTVLDQIGITEEMRKRLWRDHWQHASFSQMVELLHRGLLINTKEAPEAPTTPEEWAARDAEGTEVLYDWFRIVEIPPFYREKLIRATWNVPTRVDVRRWYDMRVVDEKELYNVYHRQGYHGKDLENYVTWTKVYVDAPVIMNHFSKGWIDEAEVRSRLADLGLPDDRVEDFIKEKVAPEKPARVEKERDVTKSEIVKGVKKGIITPSDAIELLQEMGYDEDEATYILAINIEAETGSPESYQEFRRLTALYKKSQGKEAKVPSDVLIDAGKKLKQAEDKLKAAQSEGLDPSEIEQLKVALQEAQANYRSWLVAEQG